MFLALPFSLCAFIKAVPDFRIPSQTWDAMFHYSAIRWILESGNASSLHLSAVASNLTISETAKGGFYPSAFHSLVTLTTSTDLIVACNSVVLVISTLLWPFSIGALANVLLPNSKVFPTFTVLAATTFSSFPEHIASYGVLWPSVLAFSLLPLGAIVLSDILGRNNLPAFRPVSYFIVIVASLGIALSHPSAMFAMLAICIVLLIDLSIRLGARKIQFNRYQVASLIFTLLMLTTTSVSIFNSAGFTSLFSWKREPQTTFFKALAALIFEPQGRWMGHDFLYFEWCLGAFTLLGLVIALKQPQLRWWCALWIISAYAFIVSAVVNLPLYDLLAPWYYDPMRLRAMVPIFAAPLAGLGIQLIYQRLQTLRLFISKQYGQMLLFSIFFVGLFFSMNQFGYAGSVARLEANYVPDNTADMNVIVTSDELEFIKSLPSFVKEGEYIIGDPRSGLPLIFALTGLDVAYRHINISESESFLWLTRNFDRVIAGDTYACSLLSKNNVKYFYSDKHLYLPNDQLNTFYAELDKVNSDPTGLTLVAKENDAALYTIDSCKGR